MQRTKIVHRYTGLPAGLYKRCIREHEKKWLEVTRELKLKYWKKCIDEWTMGGDNEIGREMDKQIAKRALMNN